MLSPLESWVQTLFKITKPVSSSEWLTVSEGAWGRTGTHRVQEGLVWFPPPTPPLWGPSCKQRRALQGKEISPGVETSGAKIHITGDTVSLGEGCAATWSWQVPHAAHRPPMPTTSSCFVPVTSISLWQAWPCYFWKMVQHQKLLGISSCLRYPVQSLNQGFILQFLYVKHHKLLIQTARLQKHYQEPSRVHFLHKLSV